MQYLFFIDVNVLKWLYLTHEIGSRILRTIVRPQEKYGSCRPFATSHSRDTKPPCWRAKVTLGQDKQKVYIIAGEKRSPQSKSPGRYYACVAYMPPAFVWTSTKKEWNPHNAIWSRAFGPSITRNLIKRVLTTPLVKLTQRTLAQWWSKSVYRLIKAFIV